MRTKAATVHALFFDQEPGPKNLGGLSLLLQACRYAQELQCDPWEFAVEIRCLGHAGCTHSDLRWLVCKGYAAHAQESPRRDEVRRSFKAVASLCFTEQSCFVLMPAGMAFAQQVAATLPAGSNFGANAGRLENGEVIVPKWDGQRRELRWAGVLVKRFRRPAGNQEIILASFEEEGWPPHLDNPLPPLPNTVDRQRLHDAIRRLNHGQDHRLIHFHADGTGQGICWEPRLLPATDVRLPNTEPA
jgi:hypothetical protein